MRLVVGLGNPGRRYARTRHNVGFRIVERLAERHGIGFDEERFGGRLGRGRVGARDVALLEPLTYMNASGESVAEAVRALAVDPREALMVVFDDVDLPFGRLRLRAAGSAGGHRGMLDIIDRLGTPEFPRLRFGIGRDEDAGTTDHVLAGFSAAERKVLARHVDRAADALHTWLGEGVEVAMDRFNAAAEE